MHVLFDTSPLKTGHAHRGIGLYTAALLDELKKIPELELSLSLSEAKKKKEPIHVVHYPFFDLFYHTLPLIKPAPKCVVTIHDVIPLEYPNNYPVGKKGRLAHVAQQLALKNVQLVLTDSISSMQSISKKLKVSQKKIKVVYLAGNPKIERVSSAKVKKIREEYQLPDKYILYVGDINYNKNIPQLIKSLKYIDESISLVLFGKNFKEQDIPEWQWIETQIALSDVANRVHFVNQLNSDDISHLSALYTGAEVYVQPSLAEGFGLPVLEALQCKTPVVSSKTTSLPEVGGNYVVYAEPTAESLADSITTVLEMSDSRKRKMVADGLSWAQSFSWKKAAKETVAAYSSLM